MSESVAETFLDIPEARKLLIWAFSAALVALFSGQDVDTAIPQPPMPFKIIYSNL